MDMDYEYNSNARLSTRTSIQDLQEQCAFTIGVDIRRGRLITGTIGKKIYDAKWLNNRDTTPIVLIEMTGDRISNEVYLYLTLSHDHIIRTFGVVDPNDDQIDENAVLILQEYAKDADLGGLLEGRTFIPSQNVLLEIFIQIANAMMFVVENGIVHGDLGCRNVLVYKTHPHDPKENLVKLTDFGLARPISESSSSSSTNTSYPVRFAALEILRSKGRSGYSDKSDVYSFGVLMWEACSFGKIPYHYINNDDEVRNTKLTGTRLEKPDRCDINIWKLMKLCWENDPDDRPRFTEIHKQLINIQKIESSSAHSRYSTSSSSSSSIFEERSCLFPIKFQICSDCHLRYTHHDSHLNQCNEQQLTCSICFKNYRRIVYEKHIQNCISQSNDNDISSNRSVLNSSQRLVPSSSSNRIHADERRVSPSSVFDNRSLPASDYYPKRRRPSRYSERKLSVSSQSSIDSENIKPTRHSNRETSTSQTIIEIPCEICNKSFSPSKLDLHQIRCKQEDQKRIERMREQIESQPITNKIPCEHCKKEFLIDKIDTHEKSCSVNPNTIADQLSSFSISPNSTDNKKKSSNKSGLFSKFTSIFSSNK